MITADTAGAAFGVFGYAIALHLFLTPVPTFVQIVKKGSVEKFSPVPFLATFVSRGLWVLYALPMVHPNSLLVLTTNGTGFAIETVYLILFLIYVDREQRFRVMLVMFVEVMFLGVLILLVLNYAHTTMLRSNIIGGIAMFCNIMMYAANILVMKLVIKTKNVEFMPFFWCVFTSLNGICWTIYALFLVDPYVLLTNVFGSLFGVAQLVLYAFYYRSTRRQMADGMAIVKLGLSEMGQSISSSERTNVVHG